MSVQTKINTNNTYILEDDSDSEYEVEHLSENSILTLNNLMYDSDHNDDILEEDVSDDENNE